jgi:hypothetical protein
MTLTAGGVASAKGPAPPDRGSSEKPRTDAVYNTESPARREPMPVRLNITMDEALYKRLKRELPPKRISSFIEAAVRARIPPDRATLEAAYKAAAREPWRRRIALDWTSTETEGWPE